MNGCNDSALLPKTTLEKTKWRNEWKFARTKREGGQCPLGKGASRLKDDR